MNYRELFLALDTVAVWHRCIKNWMNVSLAVVAQIIRDLDPVGGDSRRGRALRHSLYYSKILAGYGILMVMISLAL